LPTAIDVVDKLDAHALVYYCGDDFSALAGVDHEPVALMEKQLAAQADLIIVASDVLASRFPSHKTILAPHGVDYELFSAPAPRAKDLHQERPTAGFYGALADWIDVPMIAAAAQAMPDWDFVLIGHIQTDISALTGLSNVRLLGPRAHALLPSYSQHWTISMLPFRDNAQIRACNPLKMREYLAAGTPIVATPFAALDPYKDLVHIVKERATFADHLRSAAADIQRNEQRRERVRNESWESRACDISAALASL
jgi:glycosyltransferase involved in cell wall biosynthesis